MLRFATLALLLVPSWSFQSSLPSSRQLNSVSRSNDVCATSQSIRLGRSTPASTALPMNFLQDLLFGGIGGGSKFPEPCVMGDESLMSEKAHGTSEIPVQENLRWECDRKVADRICNYNRHYAEYRGYWESTPFFVQAQKEYEETGEVKFYDSNTGKLLFMAPKGRSFDNFIKESAVHGWPSFRDEETNWEYVRCLKNGETVSVDGTHLGHNLPDSSGSRYCINLVSVAGQPEESEK